MGSCRLSITDRAGAHGQQYGVYDLAAGHHDQPKELLHVCQPFPRRLTPLFGLVRLHDKAVWVDMVGRKVLDGLRKGTKDLYALNVQYVRRY